MNWTLAIRNMQWEILGAGSLNDVQDYEVNILIYH